MSDLVAIVFQDEATAFEMRAELVKMQKEYLIEMEDAVVVTKEADGKTKLHQAVNLTAAGAVGGGFWGMLIGLLFLNPLLGAAAGAASGALAGRLSDIGIDDKTGDRRPVRAGQEGDRRQGARPPQALCWPRYGIQDIARKGR